MGNFRSCLRKLTKGRGALVRGRWMVRHVRHVCMLIAIVAQVPRLAQKSLANEKNITGFALLLPRSVVGALPVKLFESDL